MVAPGNRSTVIPLDAETSDAITAWGRTVFGAPRKLARYVTRPPEVRDEVIERLAVKVLRRDVVEVTAPTSERRTTRPRLDKQHVDPFAYTDPTLRADSEYVCPCDSCRASGSLPCGDCGAAGTVRCSDCSGSGQVRKYYKKSSRLVNCKVCRASGRVRCGDCTGTGHVTCGSCRGSGHVLAWLALRQSERWDLVVAPRSPIVLAHPELDMQRGLTVEELGEFTIVNNLASERGAIDSGALTDSERSFIGAHRATVNGRLERIQAEQYLRLAVRRRDVTYEMSGARGTLVLSGNKLVGSRTSEALRPIKIRNRAWAAAVLGIAVLGLVLETVFVGRSDYFHAVQARGSVYAFVAAIIAIPFMGVLLRAWRGGLRFHSMSVVSKGLLALIPLSLGAIVVDGLVSRPSVGEAKSAIAAKDPRQAHVVAAALHETVGGTPEVLDVDDQVSLLDATSMKGDEKLKTLDTVAHRQGPAAKEAATRARAERIATIEGDIKQNDSKAAFAHLKDWFKDSHDADTSELWARAHDVAATRCDTAPCRYVEASDANAARSTPSRASARDVYRAQLLATLDPKQGDATELTAHLVHVNAVRDTANHAMSLQVSDPELKAIAETSLKWGDAERAKVPVIGNTQAVAELLLGPVKTLKGLGYVELGGATSYLALDSAGRCKGVYVVGAGASRKYEGTTSADALLSQAIGRAARLRAPANGAAVARWYEGGATVVARWHGSDLVELRIGDATP